MNNVINYLLNYAFDDSIGFISMPNADKHWLPVAVPERNLIFINMNWKNQNEIPLQIAHEIGHLQNGETCHLYNETSTATLKAEREADKYAVGLLLKYCKQEDIEFDDPSIFMQQFAIPQELEGLVKHGVLN
ncbi:ImmA/IrrE family metallo-endopeptidase [Companilactobacillus mishanensis]|uniref:ImmA/IrrE family metallo-endopeptidase n=1 Tax=Companilactobacillus mishanensis TaxID=2486008 RepID=A0A5P0ZGM2_9LACO|nr:ImmA/IrrE family metallo-endopeptidase [Companilactobacillus mishanensis]MQS52135.1 ImmA/IrrE family metallo-endopeptidase [Companilactobacillus mishanensis]